MLSEEEKDAPERLTKSRVWIVDPVDGTREYGEARTDWAVHVALAIDGVASVGAVALPGLGETLRTDAPMTVPLPPERLRMVVSRTRPAREATEVAAKLDAEAGADGLGRRQGDGDRARRGGHLPALGRSVRVGQLRARAAVALAHGLHASRIDGSPLVYNQADVYMPDLLICRQRARRHGAATRSRRLG